MLAYTVAPTESAFVWKEHLEDMKELRAEEILLFISDGQKALQTVFSPTTRKQNINHAACIFQGILPTKYVFLTATKFVMTSNLFTGLKIWKMAKKRSMTS